MKRIATAFAALMVLAVAASAPAIVINEFLYTTDGGNCFIELHNRTLGDSEFGEAVNVSGWQVLQLNGAAEPTVLATIDEGTTLTAGQFYLIASQDVFVIPPDQEADMSILPGATTVRGIQLYDPSIAESKDTVLYASAAGAATDGVQDDTGLEDNTRVLITGGIGSDDPISADIDIDVAQGAGARRVDEDAPGNGGQDSNNASLDFIKFNTGFGSPRAQGANTPVTLSVFEAR